MTGDRWTRVKALFQEAVERPADERDAFLAAATAGDAALRREVESLLAADTPDTGQIAWAAGGALLSITGSPQAFVVPLAPGQVLPPVPAGGFHADEEIARIPGARRIEGRLVTVGPVPTVYAYYRGNTQRNLYRIPIP